MKKIKFGKMIFAFLCLISHQLNISEGHFNCGTLARSTCSDSETTKWNSRMVGNSLKKWMSSLMKVRSMPKRDEANIFLRKKMIDFEIMNKFGKPVGIQGIQYIANIDCISKKNIGPTWRKTSIASGTIFHDGFLYGHENENGEMTGKNIIFVYPDMEIVLVGEFENGTMISAKQSKILRERCNRGIKEIKIARPKEGRTTFRYQRPNRLRIGDQPRVMDPYTKKTIYIGNGKKDDGVFAKRNISNGEIVMYYSGLFWNESHQALYTMDTYKNQTWVEYWDVFRNLMSFDGPMKIHIPEPYWNISNFRATLGHKVNHSFRYMKTYYGKVFHPRFGIIRSVVAQEDIKRGEEIFVNYGYRIGGNVPTWVSDLYLHETGKDWYAPKKEKNTCGCSS